LWRDRRDETRNRTRLGELIWFTAESWRSCVRSRHQMRLFLHRHLHLYSRTSERCLTWFCCVGFRCPCSRFRHSQMCAQHSFFGGLHLQCERFLLLAHGWPTSLHLRPWGPRHRHEANQPETLATEADMGSRFAGRWRR
jgi:hypothetical protein